MPSGWKVSRLIIWASVWGLSTAIATAQPPARHVGAPFTAVQTSDTVKSDGTHTIVTGTVARRGDGSTFWEMRNADGSGFQVAYDASTQKNLQCYLGRGYCTLTDGGPVTDPKPWPADYVATYFRQWAQYGPNNVQGTTVETFVSRQILEGVDVAEMTVKPADGRTFERWYSPALDLNLRMIAHYPESGTERDMRMEHVKLGEPDAKLFRIPDGYRLVKMVQGRVVEPPH